MVYDYSALLGRIVEKFGTRKRFAQALGMTPATFYSRISSDSYWDQAEIEKSCSLLDIAKEEIQRFYFTPKVHKM